MRFVTSHFWTSSRSINVASGPHRTPEKCENANQFVERGQAVPRLRPACRSRAPAFRRVPVPSTHFVRRQAGPLAHRPRMAATAFSLRGAFSGAGTVWSPRRRLDMRDTLSKHDQKLRVELMRGYCNPRCDFAWTPQKASEYISGKRDEARKEAPANATFPDVSTISSSTLRSWYAPRVPIVGWQASVDVCRVGPAGTSAGKRTAVCPSRAICPLFGCAGRF
jgi:hypothetical protein